jgi:hypothetical protein
MTKMRIELNLISLNNFSFGIFTAEGEDDNGEFQMLTLGFLLFSIDIFVY